MAVDLEIDITLMVTKAKRVTIMPYDFGASFRV